MIHGRIPLGSLSFSLCAGFRGGWVGGSDEPNLKGVECLYVYSNEVNEW